MEISVSDEVRRVTSRFNFSLYGRHTPSKLPSSRVSTPSISPISSPNRIPCFQILTAYNAWGPCEICTCRQCILDEERPSWWLLRRNWIGWEEVGLDAVFDWRWGCWYDDCIWFNCYEIGIDWIYLARLKSWRVDGSLPSSSHSMSVKSDPFTRSNPQSYTSCSWRWFHWDEIAGKLDWLSICWSLDIRRTRLSIWILPRAPTALQSFEDELYSRWVLPENISRFPILIIHQWHSLLAFLWKTGLVWPP